MTTCNRTLDKEYSVSKYRYRSETHIFRKKQPQHRINPFRPMAQPMDEISLRLCI